MKKQTLLTILAVLVALPLATAFDWTQNPLEWRPDCTYTPTLLSWYESFDQSGLQSYCWSTDSTTFYSAMDTYTNRLGEPFTPTNPDVWTVVDYETLTGNIRNVVVSFEYYAPSKDGVCVHTSVNGVTGLYNSPQYILLTNKESNLSQEGTFDDAFIQYNDEIICDEWRLFTHRVRDFENDFGSSFSGQSKSIGSIGFETKNVYVREVLITDGEQLVYVTPQ